MSQRQEQSRGGGSGLAVSLVGGDDSRLVEALESYFSALERGTPPDRREFLARYADVATRLEQCLDGLDLVRSAAVGMASETCAHPVRRGAVPALAGGRLGDYQIAGEVGRGGMGVVYEAVQVSLGRRVALKVLPAAMAADPRLLQRFRVEAQAAAQLHHAHIVPVYSVGSDQGLHYYAMQFIEGRTLAEVIADLRRTSAEEPVESVASPVTSTELVENRSRAVARLGIQAARALEHAHGLGVVHRDIKPANLMLDERGHLWVTDFGLARIQEESGLTLTGDLLGTLRYMSPEQATGRRTVVDHRADLYALGVTLYELLTLQPAMVGRDRQDLIRQIVHEEPERPRRLDPSIPRELETVLLKAMAKEPAERYATAADLAEDLRRFLEDEPILARPPTPVDRVGKWARRHRPIVAAGTILLLLTSVVLGISTVLVSRERDRVAAQWHRSDGRLGLAMRVIDEMNLAVVEKWLALDPKQMGLKYEFLSKALGYYGQLADELRASSLGRRDAALAFRRIGDIQYRLGRLDESEKAYRRSLEILEELNRASAAPRADIRSLLAGTSQQLGHLLQATIRDAEAEEHLRRALEYQSGAPGGAIPSGGRVSLAGLHLDLGLLYAREGRGEEARAMLSEALKLAEQAAGSVSVGEIGARTREAFVHVVRSHLHEVLGRVPEAVDEARLALQGYREMVERDAENLGARNGLSQATFRLAWLIGTSADPTIRDTTEAIRLARDAIEADPQNAKYHHQLGSLLIATCDPDGAEAAFRKALELVPGSPNAQNSVAWVLATRDEPTPEGLSEASELARRAVAGSPETGIFWNTFGVALYHLGRYAEAEQALMRSMSLRSGGDSFDWFFLAMTRWRQGDQLEAQRWLEQAETWMERNRPADGELSMFRDQARRVFAEVPDVLAQGAARDEESSQRAAHASLNEPGWPRRSPPFHGTAAGAVAFALGLASLRLDAFRPAPAAVAAPRAAATRAEAAAPALRSQSLEIVEPARYGSISHQNPVRPLPALR